MCKVQWVILTCTNLRTGGDLCKWNQLLMFMFAARGGTVLILACDPDNFPMKIMVDLSAPELNQRGHALMQWKIPWFQALLEECSHVIYCLKIEVRSSVVRTISLLHLLGTLVVLLIVGLGSSQTSWGSFSGCEDGGFWLR